MRASEVVALKVSDVDGRRMTLRVEQGKGRKDRYALLSPVLLQTLRTWWCVARQQGKVLRGGWLFPGMDPTDPISTRRETTVLYTQVATEILREVVSPLKTLPAS